MVVVGRKLASVRILGQHPKDRGDIQVRKGRFGPYLQHGQTVANLPRTASMDDVTLDAAIALLAERGKVLPPRGKNGKKLPAKKAKPQATEKVASVAAAKSPATIAKGKAKPKPKAKTPSKAKKPAPAARA